MHKLYRVTYEIYQGYKHDCFCDKFLFTDEQVHTETKTFCSFSGLYDFVEKYQTTKLCPGLYATTRGMLYKRRCVQDTCFESIRITEKNFNDPTELRIEFSECPPDRYGIEFYKSHLPMDNLMIFLRERYGDTFHITI